MTVIEIREGGKHGRKGGEREKQEHLLQMPKT